MTGEIRTNVWISHIVRP